VSKQDFDDSSPEISTSGDMWHYGNPMNDKPHKYSLIDIETTGSFRKGQKIIEIAILNIDGDVVVEEFSTLINPQLRIPYFITNLTGITNEAVEHAPKFYEIAKKIVEMTQDRVFVAHNVFFDFNFIKHEFSELGFTFSRDKLCTVQLARKYLPGHKSYSLGELSKDLSISNSSRHRALGDAMATFELLKLIQKKMNSQDELMADSKKMALPPLLSRECYEKLPHAIGVYYFYNSQGEIIYIGKSLDIKKRVSQHFHPNLKRRKDIELKNLIASISFVLFPHELAALVYECQEIKKYYPRYNHALKRRIFPYALKLKASPDGVYEITCTHNDGTFHPLLAVKSKRVGERRIEALMKGLVGPFENSFEKQARIDLLIKKLGIEGYNSFLEKLFYKKIPKEEDFQIPLMVKDQNLGLIKIQGHRPIEMVVRNQEGDDSVYKLDGDPDMASIVCHYLL
jgi:DNA polymerase III epsilon subunit family exonuclease